MVTIYDIARATNTSHTTVSRALRGNPLISPQTTSRIRQAAEQLGYSPSHSAKALKSGRTHTIGILARSLRSNFYNDFFVELDDACHVDGYSVFVTSSEFDDAREERSLRAFQSKRFDAVVIDRSRPGMHDGLIQKIIELGIVVVMLGEVDVPGLPYPAVGFDEPKVARLAAEHLWSLGHRQMLYVNAGRTTDNSLRVHQIRRELFSSAWRDVAGQAEVPCLETTSQQIGGGELADYFLSLPKDQRPTAIACSTDPLAFSVISALCARGVRIPDDVSILGCADDEPAFIPVPLTTIRLPRAKLARSVWGILQRSMQEGTVGRDRVVVQPELVIRQSTRAIVQE